MGFFRKTSEIVSNRYLAFSKIAIVLAIGGIFTATYQSPLYDAAGRAEAKVLDMMARFRATSAKPDGIVLVTIDVKSIQNIGRFPWDYSRHAELVRALSYFGARLVVFDILFHKSSGVESDANFASAIAEAGNVLLPVEVQSDESVMKPLPIFAEKARKLGHAYGPLDWDGALRSVPLMITVGGQTYLRLGFAAALDVLGVDRKQAVFDASVIHIPAPGRPTAIPIKNGSSMILRRASKWTGAFQTVSFNDVLASYDEARRGQRTRLAPSLFRNSVCFVGLTAPGVVTGQPRPVDTTFPPAVADAVLLDSILQRKFLSVLDPWSSLKVFWTLCVAISMIVLGSSFSRSLIRFILLAVLYFLTALVSFLLTGFLISIVYPIFLIISSFIVVFSYHQLMLGAEKRKLMKLVTKDALTTLYNYRHFRLILGSEIKNLNLSAQKQLSLVMIDIDLFKRINDTYGHGAGDEVIRGLGEVLRNNCRSLDVACRYGGEEFILMLPGTSAEDAGMIAEKIRKAIQERKFYLGEKKMLEAVTASFGVATYYPRETPENFIKRADKALYKAKSGGRNIVCRA